MRCIALILALAPISAVAAGSADTSPPTPSETTEECADGLIWDLATESCVTPEESTNDDNARLRDIRELAYAGRYHVALDVLETLDDQHTSLALTYFGFVHRQLGHARLATGYYEQALRADPDNSLARSYMGQGHVIAGNMVQAQVQLTEIRMRGGRGTWPEQSLARAIATGVISRY